MQLLKTSDGSYTLLDTQKQETYHSKFGALTESDQVFLRNSGVYQRLENKQETSILEIGFGTGFNFVHTARHAIKNHCSLHYSACELNPLPPDLVLQLLAHNAADAADLCEFTADAINRIGDGGTAAGNREVELAFNDQVSLQLTSADATRHDWPQNAYDAIYLDAFSSKNNPTLWSAAFLGRLHRAARREATLATYCVNGSFRKALTEAGFCWQKLRGPMGKREVLIARPK